MADAEPYHAVLKASYDYSPQSDDDIALTADQLLFLIEKVDDESVLPFYSLAIADVLPSDGGKSR